MAPASDDELRLREALQLAERAVGLSEPNPRVGCVLADAAGHIVGRGSTQAIGQAHAEVMALREAQAAGASLRGGTAWVTLEPCAHHGRTPPCCDALIEAGLARVVVALVDPFHAVAGNGIARMRAAGLRVDVATGAVAQAARELNIGFMARVERGRPWLRLKVASSLDGFVARPDGASRWITGPEARADGHHWRRRATAVLTGIGTVLADDPRLDVRAVPTTVQPWRVVLDSRRRLPAGAALLQPPGRVILVDAGPAAAGSGDERAERWSLPGRNGQVDLAALLRQLAAEGANEVHAEAGATLSGALLGAGLVDELLVYLAPRLIGQGRSWTGAEAAEPIADPARWTVVEHALVGPDLRLRLRPAAP